MQFSDVNQRDLGCKIDLMITREEALHLSTNLAIDLQQDVFDLAKHQVG